LLWFYFGITGWLQNLPRKTRRHLRRRRTAWLRVCFRIRPGSHEKAALCTIFTNGASLLDQTAFLQETACDTLIWLSRKHIRQFLTCDVQVSPGTPLNSTTQTAGHS
jgi:hypothetical protein